MGPRTWVGAIAAVLMLAGCGVADDGAAVGDVEPAPATTRVDSDGVAGDPAVWLLWTQMAELGLPPVHDTDPLSSASSSFTAQVMRLGCSGGRTGTVLAPEIVWSNDQIIVTFAVDPLAPGGTYECPSNDVVPYEVELGQPIGQRQLVDGACLSTDSASTSFCPDRGVRWPRDAGVETSVAAGVAMSTVPLSVPVSVEGVPPTLDSSDRQRARHARPERRSSGQRADGALRTSEHRATRGASRGRR